MSFEIAGKLIKIFPIESKTNSFQTREFVIETQENYPQLVKFQLTQDKCGIIDAYQIGQMINVSFDLRGREWQEKYFTNLQAWKINAQEAAPVNQVSDTDPLESLGADAMDDDLPF